MTSSEYMEQLKADLTSVSAQNYNHVTRLVGDEIDRVEKGTKYIEVHNDKTMKLAEKVSVPIKEHPKFNFVGKLLGPQGNSLKRLQAETGCKMSILGKGSVRDKKKEEELRKGDDPKYMHLNEELHVLVEVFAPPVDAHSRMAHALSELKKFMVPDPVFPLQDFNDDIRQQQYEELLYLNGDEEPAVPVAAPRGRGRGRGMPPPGAPRGRGASALLATPGGRGGPMSRGGMAPRGGGAPRGGPSSRGGPSPRGAPPHRGAPHRGAPSMRGSRGSGRGGPMGRGAPAPAPVTQSYEEEYGYGEQSYEEEGYGGGYTEDYTNPYQEQEYPSNTARHSNGHNTSGNSNSQYFDYAHGIGGGRGRGGGGHDSYRDDSYGDPKRGAKSRGGRGGANREQWGQNTTGYKTPGSFKAPSNRGGKPDFRSHPYSNTSGRGGQRY